jgi:two-component system, OmpR family, phosphate regulon sensor histidine kinase PhoR
MAIDLERLVDGVCAAADMASAGAAGLAAVDVLVQGTAAATGAVGATFTAHGPEGGRVVAATGAMTWALGQPIADAILDRAADARPWAGPVELLPAELAVPLRARGMAALVGHPVASGPRMFGALHLFFATADAAYGAPDRLQPALRLVTGLLGHLYRDAALPSPALAIEGDDRALFLAVAGHELRTPVTVVKGYASMLANRWDALDDGDRREAAGVLAQRADELARLVDRLLSASVGDGATGRMVRTVAFDPVEALRRAVHELPADIRRAVRADLPDHLPPAIGDPSILVSIVAELVTNAVRHTPGRSGAPDGVEVQAGADPHTVFVRVCDRGVGIDPAHVERAFERFWRARRDADDGRAGVGLGLYLVRRLIERQNGWVSLRAREGGGTIAEVRLPRADDDRPDDHRPDDHRPDEPGVRGSQADDPRHPA